MARGLKKRAVRGKSKSKLIVRMLTPMLAVVILQLVIFFSILILGGEFDYVKRYAYSSLVEKTETRKNYIQSELEQKMPFVQDASVEMNGLITSVIANQGAKLGDIRTNRDLVRVIMESSVESMVNLLRRSGVNDVYLILDTGDLYDSGANADTKAALYLRDLDTTTDGGYQDLLMEMGFTSISQKYGIILDTGWSLHFEANPSDTRNFDFYYKTIRTAQGNDGADRAALGYWSGFSKSSNSAVDSMKYTMPLVADNGEVYGILGIGLTESTVLANLPYSDFISETACYVLARNLTKDTYDIMIHSGAAFSDLIGNASILQVSEMLGDNVCDFATSTGVGLAGSVQEISLYGSEGPYATERWALISVADRASVLRALNDLINMLVIAAAVSVAVSFVVGVLSSIGVVRPISRAIKTMRSVQSNRVIRFQPSNILEIDRLTDAITQLQINVQDFSTQVSQMIRIADVGLGTFMYDRTDDTVFVGQSLPKLLQFKVDLDEDTLMSREGFLDMIMVAETREAIIRALQEASLRQEADYTDEYSIVQSDGTQRWIRLNLVHNKNKSIGVIQDITSVMMEKQRIEYERDYDSTTGLLNRRAYYQRLGELFHDRSALKTTAIVMMDLDNLKYVNDTYGHDFGDDYIKTAAAVLKKFQAYGGIVSRLSGDEFNVCLPGFSSKDEVRDIIARVREQLLQSSCLLADGTHFRVRASAGVAWYPDDAQTYETLMKYADFAMYTIKHSKKGGIAEFDLATYSQDSVLLTGVEEVNRIIDERSVRYAFQPIVSAKTGKTYGYEALMRPQSNIFQSHLELLRTAKTGAKLYELERLTWMKALEDFQTQIDTGNIASNSHIFINSIVSCALEPEDMDAIEAEHGNLLSQVVLEILEGESANEEYIHRKMERMKKWKAQIALDDFGMSYNSEAMLSSIGANIVKIDRSIISGCDKDVSRRAIITRLVKVARAKNILVLAGGVETEDEVKAVVSCGVDLLQGYFICRPLFEPQMLSPDVQAMLRSISAKNANQK